MIKKTVAQCQKSYFRDEEKFQLSFQNSFIHKAKNFKGKNHRKFHWAQKFDATFFANKIKHQSNNLQKPSFGKKERKTLLATLTFLFGIVASGLPPPSWKLFLGIW